MTTAPPPSDSAFRKAMIWAFGPPASAHVSVTAAVDFSEARAYLDRLAAGGGGVSVQHLLVATVGRVLTEFPEANARVIGGEIVRFDRVGVLVPVNLVGHAAGAQRALGVAIVEDAGARSLRDLGSSTRSKVDSERSGDATNPLWGAVLRLAGRLPQRAITRGLDRLVGLTERPALRRVLARAFPATTMMSNVGSVLGAEVSEGMLVRGVSMAVPHRMFWLGTMWATSYVQDEVVAVDGRVEVRPMLPVVCLFDHRLIDGVRAGRMIARFASILKDPEAAFGADGRG